MFSKIHKVILKCVSELLFEVRDFAARVDLLVLHSLIPTEQRAQRLCVFNARGPEKHYKYNFFYKQTIRSSGFCYEPGSEGERNCESLKLVENLGHVRIMLHLLIPAIQNFVSEIPKTNTKSHKKYFLGFIKNT